MVIQISGQDYTETDTEQDGSRVEEKKGNSKAQRERERERKRETDKQTGLNVSVKSGRWIDRFALFSISVLLAACPQTRASSRENALSSAPVKVLHKYILQYKNLSR